MDCNHLWAFMCCVILWAVFYYLKCGDNSIFPILLIHGIEIINEMLCGEALGKLECALHFILCMKFLSLVSYLFIKIGHMREKKTANVKAERKKACQHFLPTTRGLSSPEAERSWSHTAVTCLGDWAESDSPYPFLLEKAGIWSLSPAMLSLFQQLSVFFQMALEYKIGDSIYPGICSASASSGTAQKFLKAPASGVAVRC